MLKKEYTNFVRPLSPTDSRTTLLKKTLSGTEAKKLYLEEVIDVKDPVPAKCDSPRYHKTHRKRKISRIEFCQKELFLSVQNNDISKLTQILDAFPNKLNSLDVYGWSLLMIACQANAVEIVKELLKRGIDISIRDKAGNSARSLVIKNKNFVIADLLLSYRTIEKDEIGEKEPQKLELEEEYVCNICNNKFSNKKQHLSSTLHNLNASKGKKIPSNYVIPESNKGYQIMLKGGWNKEAGLGPDGSGKKYPLKATQKTDKTGLGHKKRVKEKNVIAGVGSKLKNFYTKDYNKNRQMEINFRRQFY
ncbi:unnamed protein product [Parnassius apollo]|uniref:(apollo) hypothetical protein n=1 Tax=Parnassius apollo TaxID=110799 RepID=A0A8S3WEG3_PARAO|nr:unnamed protein product [Parnassius apollo]